MDDISALALGGVVGIVLAVSYKIYTTISSITESASSVITKVKSSMGITNNESKKE